MKKIYESYLDRVSEISSEVERCNAYLTFLRSLTQTVSLVCLDIAFAQLEYDEVINTYISRMREPSDGLPHEVLEYVIPIFRTYIDDSFMKGWFQDIQDTKKISTRYLKSVEFRNDTIAHGVLDSNKAGRWVSDLEALSKDFLFISSPVIPTKDRVIKLISGYKVSIPLAYENYPFVIKSIKNKQGLWQLKGQTLSISHSKDFTIDLGNNSFFDIKGINNRGYELIELKNKSKDIVFHNIPIRQTDTFEGRESEFAILNEWYEDEDSRTCMIYGDGGYGKTTFIIESLNRYLEGNIDFHNNKPLYICYYSAKMTKWTEDGLTFFKSLNPVIDDCIREVVKIQENLSKEWFKVEGKALVDKTRDFLQKNNIKRDEILLIIDNTETMAGSASEIIQLSEIIKYISRNIARVIITSRRREVVQAEPILIEGLKEAESVDLIRTLATKYNVDTLNKAGEKTLRKVSKKLMYKPLLIEAYVKYIKRSDVSIEMGLQKFYKVSKGDLLEFLYEDAWQRMNELQRLVFLVAVQIEHPINEHVLSKICQLAEINIDEFTRAYEETYFAEVIQHSTGLTFEVVDLAKQYFNKKLMGYSSKERDKISDMAKQVIVYIEKVTAMQKAYRSDRVSEAFRSEPARFAKIYNDQGETSQAIDMYEIAIQEDPLNSYLHERYAWLLINKTNRFEKGLNLANKALELDENNVDAVVGMALAYYKLENLIKGDEYIDKSIGKGRSEAFGLLRKGIARYHIANKIKNNKDKENLYAQSIKYLRKSQDSLRNTTAVGYEAKVKSSASSYLNLALKRYNDLRL